MSQSPYAALFYFPRRLAFYESDAMGILHHSNYLRLFEEARLHWLRDRKLEAVHFPKTDLTLAVLETECKHLHPVHLDDELRIYVTVRSQGLKIEFQYVIFSNRFEEPVAMGRSLHVMLDKEFKVKRPPKELLQTLEKETWIEILP